MKKFSKLFCLLLLTLSSASVFGQWTTIPGHITASWYNCGAAYNGRVYFTAGGSSAAVTICAYDAAVHYVDLASNAIGVLPGGLLSGRMSIMCVAYDGKIYFAGGHKWISGPNYLKLQVFNNFEIYDIASGTWDMSHHLTEARGSGAATIVDGKIMFAGGYKVVNGVEQPSDLVEIWNPATQNWEPAQHLSQARAFLGAATIGNQAWFCGGETNYATGAGSTRVDIYKNGSWETKELSLARSLPAVVAVGNFVLAAGGFFDMPGQGGATNRVDRFDTLSNTLNSLDVLSTSRGGIGAAVIGRKAYFTGGGGLNAAGSYFNSSTSKVDVFDADEVSLSLSPYKMNEARAFHTCAVWGNKIIVGGGWHPEIDPTYGTTGSVETLTDNSVPVKDPVSPAIAFTISPNPASNALQVVLAEDLSEKVQRMLSVTDIFGKIIFHKALTISDGQTSLSLDLSAFPAGVYFLTLAEASRQVASRKFVVLPR